MEFWWKNIWRGFSYVVLGGVGLGAVHLFLIGLIDQWLRYRDYLAQGMGFHDGACPTPYCDFVLFWEAGRLARLGDPAGIYDKTQFLAATSRLIAPHVNDLPFLYPPFNLLAAGAMSVPPLVPAYYLFTAIALMFSVVLLWRAGIPWRFIMLSLAGLPAIWTLYLGQFGMICGALLVGGLLLLKRHPWIAGALLAALCLKPQYALLVPVVVLASGNFRAMLAGAAGVAVFAGLSVLCFGWQAWAIYLGPGQATMRAILEAPFQPGYEMGGISIFWLARSLGGTVGTAYAVQTMALLAAAVATWRLWRRDEIDPIVRLVITICLTALASPYGFADDLFAYSVVLPMLARRNTPVTNAALALLWLAPAYSVAFTYRFLFLPMPFCLAAALLIAWRAGRNEREDEAWLAGSSPAMTSSR